MSRPSENPPIPFKRPKNTHGDAVTKQHADAPAYAELQCLTNFSFLKGASHPGEMVIQAKTLGHTAIGIADINTLAGVVRAHAEAKKEGIQLLVGACIQLTDEIYGGLSCLCYPTDRKAYGRLCKMLSDGKRSALKGECHIALNDLVSHAEGQVLILLPPDKFEEQKNNFAAMAELLLQAGPTWRLDGTALAFSGDDRRRMRSVAALANDLKIPLVATNAAFYHIPERRRLQGRCDVHPRRLHHRKCRIFSGSKCRATLKSRP